MKLVARFYDADEGRVLVDGHPLKEVDLTKYRQQIGYVPQEPFLFSGSLRDNIAYGRPEASDAEVEAAARGWCARLHRIDHRRLPPCRDRTRPVVVVRPASADLPRPRVAR